MALDIEEASDADDSNFESSVIGQGDPLSMVLYQYYNADLLDIPKLPSELAAAYVNDVILIVTAKTFKGVHTILADMMTREGGAMEWARQHNSKFEM